MELCRRSVTLTLAVIFAKVLFLGAVLAKKQDACIDAAAPPIIDISPLHVESERGRRQETVREIGKACQEWGFFQVINHNVDLTLLQTTREKMRGFFELPVEEKNKVKRTQRNSRGFANDELTKQKQDWKEILDFGGRREDNPAAPTQDGYNQWPELHGFRSVLQEYYEANVRLAQLLMDAIVESVGADPSIVRNNFVNHTSFARLNYYPKLPATLQSSKALGISRHTDAGALTILWQDSAGLEVYSGTKEDNKDGSWVPVIPPSLDAFTINIGDMMHVWTGGKCPAPEHRVIANHDRERYSLPFFYNPAYDVVMQPLPNVIGSHQVYRPFTWGQFRLARFAGDYADVGTETQIEDWELVSPQQ